MCIGIEEPSRGFRDLYVYSDWTVFLLKPSSADPENCKLKSAHIHYPAEHYYEDSSCIRRLGDLELHLLFENIDGNHPRPLHALTAVIHIEVQDEYADDEQWFIICNFCESIIKSVRECEAEKPDAAIAGASFHRAIVLLRALDKVCVNKIPINKTYVGSKTTPINDNYPTKFVQNVRFHFLPVWIVKVSPDQVAFARANYFNQLDFEPKESVFEPASSFLAKGPTECHNETIEFN